MSLHVVGRRADRYHLLDSLVMFAGPEAADVVYLAHAAELGLEVVGPLAAGVPDGPDNLVWKAASLLGRAPMKIILEKHLPHAAGIGGGTADGAAVVRALGGGTAEMLVSLGADMPVCALGRAARMQGIGETVSLVEGWPALPVVLVNPGIGVSTPDVFRSLRSPNNAPMPDVLPRPESVEAAIEWLLQCRNDLQGPALEVAPVIDDVLAALGGLPGCGLARMSGSGATCFGVFETIEAARAAEVSLAGREWWVRATMLS